MNAYLKTVLICLATLAVVARVPAVKTIVIGA